MFALTRNWVMKDREDDTKPFAIAPGSAIFAKGTMAHVRQLIPAFMAGDWLRSPSGTVGYVAGRSCDNPRMWMFVVKTGKGSWDSTVVEMFPEAFIGFKKVKQP